EKGNFLWNSGMFCFKSKTYLEELKTHSPTIFDYSFKAWVLRNDFIPEYSMSKLIPDVSIDYAVMEKTKKIKVVKSDFYWNDVGSFSSLYDYLILENHPVDAHGNMVIGTNKHTEFIGFEDSILISTENALLLLKKEKAQEVKEV